MRKINIRHIPEEPWTSARGRFAGVFKGVSIALGRKPQSTDLLERHPFDVELCRVPPGKRNFPYHAHSAQWEFYIVLSGSGTVRCEAGTERVEPGDSFVFPPGEAHQIINDGPEDLIYYVIADNPIGESCYYPDSKKWGVYCPQKQYIRSGALEYEDGEE